MKKTDKLLLSYMKCVNSIEDFMEYMYKSCTKEEIKKEIMAHIDELVNEIKEIKDDE